MYHVSRTKSAPLGVGLLQIDMQPMLVYRFLRQLSDWVLCRFYADVYVCGEENVPLRGPVILCVSDPSPGSGLIPCLQRCHSSQRNHRHRRSVQVFAFPPTGRLTILTIQV